MKVYISKAQKSIEVSWEAMPENAKEFIISYGLRQKLNDAGSSATKKGLGTDEAGAQAFALAENVLASLMNGEVTVRSAASNQSLEERIFSRVLRAVFKQVCKRSIAKEADDSDSALLEAIALETNKEVSAIQAAVQTRAAAELLIEKTKQDLPSVEI